jgi:hypothetical protein
VNNTTGREGVAGTKGWDGPTPFCLMGPRRLAPSGPLAISRVRRNRVDHSIDPASLKQPVSRLETLYWDALRNGGPDVELLAILRLLESGKAPGNELCRHCGHLGDKGAGYCSRACHAAAEGLDAPDFCNSVEPAEESPSAEPQQQALFPEHGYSEGA